MIKVHYKLNLKKPTIHKILNKKEKLITNKQEIYLKLHNYKQFKNVFAPPLLV